ncbi:MAG: peptide chain release factor 3 [Fimbriimonadaceae bacterium]|nr:peptide chain release factor 3 [Fimbriimonadaceae bacterium]
MADYSSEIARRRTFAIISHPDAGKTTLTEKLLLYGGAIQLAGTVTARKNQRKATSDWMELEKQRGISVTSTVLQFEYQGHVLNLLDTPGHDDFSADTYRTLTAADSAVMLIDNAKGVETQTRKLFAVCRQRGIPIFTFVNKMDHPGRGPLELLTEVEDTLGIKSVPMNWPIGQGDEFRGVYDRESNEVHLFGRVARGAQKADVIVLNLDDPALIEHLSAAEIQTLRDEIDLISIAGESFDETRVLAGELTPVFFGSAIWNFGVELFLQRFMHLAPAPGPRCAEERKVNPEDTGFTGFVFKIQANMDPNHRDRIAFLRIVSGKFEKDMQVNHPRLGKPIRLTRPQRLFANERETVEEAYAGDIVGLTNVGAFILGDTLVEKGNLTFSEVTPFAPELFATLINRSIDRFKHFEKGVEQLCDEGLSDVFYDPRSAQRNPILGVVGRLQFDVIQYRLESEYGVKTILEPMAYELMCWLEGDAEEIARVYWGTNAKPVQTRKGDTAVLIASEWHLGYLQDKNPTIRFHRQADWRRLVLRS